MGLQKIPPHRNADLARIKLSFPDNAFYFETKMPVRITDINGANHLGNDALISMLSEARAQVLECQLSDALPVEQVGHDTCHQIANQRTAHQAVDTAEL